MRKRYTSALKSRADEFFAASVPSFSRFQEISPVLVSSEYPYVSRVFENLWLFVVLFIHPKGKQAFTFEFGWSRLRRFPEVSQVRCFDSAVNRERFPEDEYLQRIRVFFGEDRWWFLEDQSQWADHFKAKDVSLGDASLCVDEAFTQAKHALEDHLMPYFGELIAFEKAR
jgi:hypothetical protein